MNSRRGVPLRASLTPYIAETEVSKYALVVSESGSIPTATFQVALSACNVCHEPLPAVSLLTFSALIFDSMYRILSEGRRSWDL